MPNGPIPPTRHPIVREDLAAIIDVNLPWMDLDHKTVLVSGANGFVASYLIQALLFRNETCGHPLTKVIAIVRNAEKANIRYAAYANRPDLEIIVQDVTSPVDYSGPVDFVVHAASQASPKYYGIDPVGTHLANTLGTYNLLHLASRNGASDFLFVSSGEVYGDTSALPNPIGEDQFGPCDPVILRSCYAEGKRAGENLCVSWSHQYGLRTKIARLSHTYGPGMQLDDGRVFADFVANAVAGTDIILKSDGKASRPFCYLSDACIGLLTILLKGQSSEAYNLANDDAVLTIGRLAEIVCSLVPNKAIKPVYRERLQTAGYITSLNPGSIPDTTKIRALGWAPTVSAEDGFRRTIESYKPYS